MKTTWMAACLTLAACGQNPEPSEPSRLTTRTQGRFLTAGEAIQGEYIVVLKERPAPGLASVGGVADGLASDYAVKVTDTYSHALRGFAIQASEAQARALSQDPDVAYVQENGVVRVEATQANPPAWGLDRIDQDSLPLNQQYTYDSEAANVHAYVIDTGLRTSHSEFEGRATRDFDVLQDGMNGDDCHGHGTHVAATLGGKQYGVAKKVRLHGIRVLGCGGTGSFAGIIAGVDWVTANAQRPAVVNMSLTGAGDEAVALDTAVTNSINSGLVYVAAAGNSGVDACGFSPARVPAAITVGATSNNDWRASFSNWGTCLDIFAPGDGILSAWKGSDTDSRLNNGTSMAAPHVAGAAAILLSQGVAPANVATQLLASATQNKVQNPGNGSPNRLLFTGPAGPLPPALVNGAPTTVGDNTGGVKDFYLEVPAGVAKVTFTLSGGTGDADLYVRQGAIPGLTAYDCRPMRKGNNEVCTMYNPAPGRWYAQLRAFSTYANVSLKGEF